MIAVLDFTRWAFEFTPDAAAAGILGATLLGLLVGAACAALMAVRRHT